MMKKAVGTFVLLLAATVGMMVHPAWAQYSGASGGSWNNPASATASLLVQQHAQRQLLKNSLHKKHTARKRVTKKTSPSARSIRHKARH